MAESSAKPMDLGDSQISEEPPSSFRVKTIMFGSKVVSICMQNENGPCPLLAICNALLLKGEMYIHPDQSFVSISELLTQLSTVILKHKPSEFPSVGEQKNYEENIAATMSTFHELSRGLDVNVRFSDVFAYEFTVQSAIFDLVGVPLCHGWLPEPSSRACALVKFSSYNQAAEKVIKANDELERITNQATSESSAPVEPIASSSSAEAPAEERPITEETLVEIEHGQMIGKWLEETASQLTFQGILKLHEQLNEGQLFVFFRNNHFSTLLKQEASLWILITDQGYTKQAAVWEKLDNVLGDSHFVTSEFLPYTGTADDYVALPDVESIAIQQEHERSPYQVSDPATDLDEQLARQLQQAENSKAAQQQAQQQGHAKRPNLTQSHQPRGHPQQPGAAKRPLNQSAPGGRPKKGPSRPATSPTGPDSATKEKSKDDDCVIL